MADQYGQLFNEETQPAPTDRMFITDNVAGTSAQRMRYIEFDRLFGSVLSVKWRGATGDGVTDDTTAIQNTIDEVSSAGGGIVFFPEGSYLTSSPLTLASNVYLEGVGDSSMLLNVRLEGTGTAGSEIAFTSPASKGDTTISIPATGLSGEWIRISSVINAGSTDAGVDQLSHTSGDDSYLSEFVQIETGNVSTADLYSGVVFPYSNTPGTDTDGSITTSVARQITWLENSGVRNLKIIGKQGSEVQIAQLKWCRNFIIDECTIDANDTTVQCVEFLYCLDCHVRNSTLVGKRTSIPASGATTNQVIFASSTQCSIDNSTLEGGRQSVDITYEVSDLTYRGGPSISCGGHNCRSINPGLEGFTDHYGCLATYWINCNTIGGLRGIRTRSRGSRIHSCFGQGHGSGIGILIDDAGIIDCDVSHNRIDGYGTGIQLDHSQGTSYDALIDLLAGTQGSISHNRVSNTSGVGIVCAGGSASDTRYGPRITQNIVQSPGTDGISVLAYNNGTVIDQNLILDVTTSNRAGIKWGSNIQDLFIGDNYVFGVAAGATALEGSSTSSFITDTTTFPGGEADANLFVGTTFTDAATPFNSILADNTAYRQPLVVGWQPFVASLGIGAPSLERSSFGIYEDGGELVFKVKDASGNILGASLTLVDFASGESAATFGAFATTATGTFTSP